jgi:putative membrane protein
MGFGSRADSRGRDPWSPGALVYRFVVNGIGLLLAAFLVPGIEIGDFLTLVAVTAIFALVNLILRPIAFVVGFCLIVLTFGLFVLIINTALLGATAWLAGQLDLDFTVDGFWSAFFGALVISLVSLFATMSLRMTRI